MSQPREFHPEYDALRREYNDFRYFLPDALIEIDLASLQVLYINRQAELMFGFTTEDVAHGLNGAALMAIEEFPRAVTILQGFIAESRAKGTPYVRSGRQDIFEQHLRRKDGSLFWGETQTSMVLDSKGIPVRMLSIIRDVSHRKG